jgi:hypothetical protein
VSPTPVLDLSYADPPPPADLADRARRGGRRLRRCRRVGTTAAALAVATAAGAVVSGVLAPERPVSPAVALPTAVPEPVATATWPDGATARVFVSGDGESLCYGPRVTAGLQDGITSCGPLNGRRGVPGFGSRGANIYDPDGDGVGSADGRERYLVHGQVIGEVTRVQVTTLGTTVDATLVRSTDPRVGTLFAAAFGPTRVAMNDAPALVAYRGDRELFRCDTSGRCSGDRPPAAELEVDGVPVTPSP